MQGENRGWDQRKRGAGPRDAQFDWSAVLKYHGNDRPFEDQEGRLNESTPERNRSRGSLD